MESLFIAPGILLWALLSYLSGDAPLDPRIAAYQSAVREIPPAHENGFVYFLGMSAPAGDNVVGVGLQRLQNLADGYAIRSFKPGLDRSVLNAELTPLKCGYGRPHCEKLLALNCAKQKTLLSRHGWLLQRYRQLLTFERYVMESGIDLEEFDTLEVVEYGQILSFIDYVNSSQCEDVRESKFLLVEDTARLRNLLSQSDSVYLKSGSIGLLTKQYKFISEFVQSYKAPALNSDLFRPFSRDEMSLRDALYRGAIMETGRVDTRIQKAMNQFSIPNELIPVVLKRNVVVNHQIKGFLDQADASVRPILDFKEPAKTEYVDFSPWNWNNYLGQSLMLGGPRFHLELDLKSIESYIVLARLAYDKQFAEPIDRDRYLNPFNNIPVEIDPEKAKACFHTQVGDYTNTNCISWLDRK